MGNFATGVKQKEKREERDKTARETLGKTFHDLGKTTFAVMVLGAMSSIFGVADVNVLLSIGSSIVGLALSYGFIFMGNRIIKNK